MIVIVYVHAIALPFAIAAAVQVVGGNHPIRIVVEHDAARPEIHPPRDEFTSHVLVAAMRISPPGLDAVVIGISIAVMRVVRIIPASVIPVVMPVAVIASMFVPAFMFPVIVFIISAAVLRPPTFPSMP